MSHGYLYPISLLDNMKINNFRGDLADTLAKTKTLIINNFLILG